GEVLARQDRDAGAWPGALLVQLRRLRVLLRVLQVAGDQRRVIRVGAGAVVDVVLAPAAEDVAVRVGERVGDVDLALLRARLVAEGAGVGEPLWRAVGRLDLAVVEDALLPVDG